MTRNSACIAMSVALATAVAGLAIAQPPVLFPAGGKPGTKIQLEGVSSQRLLSTHSGITFEEVKAKNGRRFVAHIAKNVPTGVYDVYSVAANGTLSAPRLFFVSNRSQAQERADNDVLAKAERVPLGAVICGRLDPAGDVDCFRFRAKAGRRVVVECRAASLDSKSRAVLRVFRASGEPLAVSRGFFGTDPLIVFDPPEDGEYVVQVTDLVYRGGKDYVYRLNLETGPRVVFAKPAMVPANAKTKVTVFGWNLSGQTVGSYESREVTVDTTRRDAESVPIARHPAQIGVRAFPYRYPGADQPLLLGLTTLPIVSENSGADVMQALPVPVDLTGQLIEPNETDVYQFQARKGDVLHVETFSQRLGAPTDLSVAILDEDGKQELASFQDELLNLGGRRFPTTHLDAEGRWVVPRTGRYQIAIRDLIGGANRDQRRVYSLRLRGEEPDMQLAVVPRPESPSAVNIPAGGRAMVEVLAFRRRALDASIQIGASNLPDGVTADPIWLGPGVNRGWLVLSATAKTKASATAITLTGRVNEQGLTLSRRAVAGTMTRSDLPNGRGRIASRLMAAVAGKSQVRAVATCKRERFQQGSIIDIQVEVQRPTSDPAVESQLRAAGLPERIRNRLGTIEPLASKGTLSLYLPPDLRPGRYSIVTEVRTKTNTKNGKPASITLFTNPVSFEVYPAPFIVEVDLEAPRRVKQGQIVRVNYTARRRNGFIGKIHTELRAAGSVEGLRGRGVTFVGQTESGTIQIIATENAMPGRQTSLRLEAVGTVEDEPVYLGSCFLHLEIVE